MTFEYRGRSKHLLTSQFSAFSPFQSSPITDWGSSYTWYRAFSSQASPRAGAPSATTPSTTMRTGLCEA
jgi:hypothetical protein